MRYLSDEEPSDSDKDDNNDKELMQTGPGGCTAEQIDHGELDMQNLNADEASFRVQVPPQPKRQKLDVPAQVACQQA